MSEDLPAFSELAAMGDPPLDLLALAIAAEFRPVDAGSAFSKLDALGEEIAALEAVGPDAEVAAVVTVLGARHSYAGETANYDDPRNSMLDLVLERRRGLPILLSVLYVEAASRGGITLSGVGLPGHFVVGHFGVDPPLLVDPFARGRPVGDKVPRNRLGPWSAPDIGMRMLNNLVPALLRRGDIGAAIRAAQMRLELPSDAALREAMELEARRLQARLN